MYHPQPQHSDLHDWLIDIVTSNTFQQIAPLLVLFLVPAFFILVATKAELNAVTMGLDNLLPWNWFAAPDTGAYSSDTDSEQGGGKEKRRHRRHRSKSAMDVIPLSKSSRHRSHDGHYPGLVNISGTYCFMNSTLQAMSSLAYLQPHISQIHARAEALDVPTPVIDALQELFTELNTPHSSYTSIRPTKIIDVLTHLSSDSSNQSYAPRTTSLFYSREHQDAQELFQLLSECIKNEIAAVDKEILRDRGLGGLGSLLAPHQRPSLSASLSSSLSSSTSLSHTPAQTISSFASSPLQPHLSPFSYTPWPASRSAAQFSPQSQVDKSRALSKTPDRLEVAGLINKSVFDGLTANRRSCMTCNYTEAVMHFSLDNWQLAVPRLATSCRLEDCLQDYTRIEMLYDCICRNCSLRATHKRLVQEIAELEQVLRMPSETPSDPSGSTQSDEHSKDSRHHRRRSLGTHQSKATPSKKKRLREVKKMERKVKSALDERRIEDELEGVRIEKVISKASTKQAMIARPPPVLALHLNRSIHLGHYASKNNAFVVFPELLDLTPYTTSGSLSTNPMTAISSSSSASPFFSQSQHARAPASRGSANRWEGRTLYRLSAVVCHFGGHSFGHYICYKRKPQTRDGEWVSPRLVRLHHRPRENGHLEGAQNGRAGREDERVEEEWAWEDELVYSDEEGEPGQGNEDPRMKQRRRRRHPHRGLGSGKGWLRTSDDSVTECGIESVLKEGSGAFMLYYERVVVVAEDDSNNDEGRGEAQHAARIGKGTGKSAIVGVGTRDVNGSEETLRPRRTVSGRSSSGGEGETDSEDGLVLSSPDPQAADTDASAITNGHSVPRTLTSTIPRDAVRDSAGGGHALVPIEGRIVRSVSLRSAASSSSLSSLSPAPSSLSSSPPEMKNGIDTPRATPVSKLSTSHSNGSAHPLQHPSSIPGSKPAPADRKDAAHASKSPHLQHPSNTPTTALKTTTSVGLRA